jgi:hypothetical protein
MRQLSGLLGLLLVSTQPMYAQESPAFEKVRDVSPDGKFALRISCSSKTGEVSFSSLASTKGLAAKGATGSQIDPQSAAKRQLALRTSWIAQLLLRNVLFGVASLALKKLPAEPGSGDIVIVSRDHFICRSY